MPTHVALLRGINVGGHNRIAMPDLREVVAALGHTEVTTYIQSGNVVFTANAGSTAEIAGALSAAIAEKLGVRPAVVVLTCGELAKVVAVNPYPGEPDPRRVHAVFFGEDRGPGAAEAIAAAQRRAAERGSRDEARLLGRTLFLHTPDGFGRSELAALLLGKAGGAAANGTARNWATVIKLLELCRA